MAKIVLARVIRTLLFLFISCISLPHPLQAELSRVIEAEGVICLFEEPLRPAATEVITLYPRIRRDLEETLKRGVNFRPTVLLTNNRELFQRMIGSHLFVAFADPRRMLIVIDYTKMNTHPFTLAITLKHELCHLLLHHRIGSDNLPKWLDEGVAQWVSDGVAEIIMDSRKSVFDGARLSKNYISLRRLVGSFPEDERSLQLAYEESKSLIDYINREFGRDGILEILSHLENGYGVDEAIHRGLSISTDELEKRWYNHLSKRATWFRFFSTNLYGILFFLAALITVGGFIRLVVRKRHYEDDGDSS